MKSLSILIFVYLLIYLGDHDMPCPLQLACRCTLTTTIGREIAKYLIRHGANINYQDHALRNALYWTVSQFIKIFSTIGKLSCIL